VQFIENTGGPVDYVEMTKRDGVEGPGNDGDPVHTPTLSPAAFIIPEVV
jgi:hypothetical protein